MEDNEIMIIDENSIKDKIYTIRGIQVMLDSDIAKYFDVSTANLNRAMKRNIDRFPKEFCFKLNYDEASRFQIGTLNISGNKKGNNIKYLSYIYYGQGIYMFMTVLKGELAIKLSKAFNQQTQRNIARFDENFRFQLNEDEISILRCQNVTTKHSSMSRSNPYVFSEQGIYMLMTVLKGELAIRQSKAFNQQVQRNIDKFDEDFSFNLIKKKFMT